jgi:ABC-type Na+ efflux pump permease subunit
MNDPHGTLAVVFSMIPLTSPIVMLMRIPFGVPLWQIAISVSFYLRPSFSSLVCSKNISCGILMYGRNLHGKNYTNGLNIKVCLVDSFSRNLKANF